jgi:hypothetical protein
MTDVAATKQDNRSNAFQTILIAILDSSLHYFIAFAAVVVPLLSVHRYFQFILMSTTTTTTTTRKNVMTRTILRIKRRRTDEPLPFIRLEGLDGRKRSRDDPNDNDEVGVDRLSEMLDTTQLDGKQQPHETTTPAATATATIKHHKSSAVWRRLDEGTDNETTKKRSCRIVDALLEEEEDGRLTKRRKLTLLETRDAEFPSTISVKRGKPKGSPLKVLDPLTRMVDDSLQQVHTGSKPVWTHYQFVSTDSRLAHESKKWLGWCHSSGGNIFHACALWNEIEIMSDLCQSMPTISTLVEAVDGDGRTPYEVAQLSGHESVCQVLEAFGGDATNFVYDIYDLEEPADDNDTDNENNNGGNSQEWMEKEQHAMTTVELKGGVGYWTPDGQLILEAPEKSPASLTHVFDEDGEIDSNCEEYGGNDYPEEEDDDDDDDDDWRGQDLPDSTYRNYQQTDFNGEIDHDDYNNNNNSRNNYHAVSHD